MSFSSPAFILAMFAMAYGAWILVTWIRARHGYPVENEWGGMSGPVSKEKDEATDSLLAENKELKETVGRLEERLKVLERIATDPARQLADDIDKLR